MGYLFFQTWIWMLLAALLGLFIGWLIWGRSSSASELTSSELKRQLDRCQARCAELEASGSQGGGGAGGGQSFLDTVSGDNSVGGSGSGSSAGGVVGTAASAAGLSGAVAGDSADSGLPEIKDEWRPAGLSEPNNGKGDDLKRIKGVGPVIQKTLNGLGVYHFYQVGDFTDDNIKWVDNYIAFPGRIYREDWVNQAKKLAQGVDTEFSNRYDKGETGGFKR